MNSPQSKFLNVAVAGTGRVGRQVIERLHFLQQQGVPCGVKVAVGRQHKPWLDSYGIAFTDSIHTLAQRHDIDVIVECLGGVQSAYQLLASGLAHRKHVVTCNTALMGAYGSELMAQAQLQGNQIGLEGVLNGYLPVGAWVSGLPTAELTAYLDTPVDAALKHMAAAELSFYEACQAEKADFSGKTTLYRLLTLQQVAFGHMQTQQRKPLRYQPDRLTYSLVQLAMRMGGTLSLQGKISPHQVKLGLVLQLGASSAPTSMQESIHAGSASLALPPRTVDTAAQGIVFDVLRLADSLPLQPAVADSWQNLGVRQQKEVPNMHFIGLPLAQRAVLRRDVRWQVVHEEVDTRHLQVGVFVESAMTTEMLQAALGGESWVLPVDTSGVQDAYGGMDIYQARGA